MSWSVDVVVKTGAQSLEAKVHEAFAKTSVPIEAERAHRDQICALVCQVLKTNNDGIYMKVQCSGSYYRSADEKTCYCNAKMIVEPIYGAVID